MWWSYCAQERERFIVNTWQETLAGPGDVCS